MTSLSDASAIVVDIQRLKMQRKVRDSKVIEKALLASARTLMGAFEQWTKAELDDLTSEASLVMRAVPGADARNRIKSILSSLESIRTALPDARTKLGSFIEVLEVDHVPSPDSMNRDLQDDLNPAITLLRRILEIRESLDGMADMIPR